MFISLFYLQFACRNPCQDLCVEIRDMAEECDQSFTDEMFKTCRKNQRKKDRDQKKSCASAAPKLEEEWTCEDLEVYFDDETGGALFDEQSTDSYDTGD